MRSTSGFSALAMPRRSYWTMAAKKGKRAPGLDRFQCPGAPFIKKCGPADSRQLIRLPPSARPLFTIKNEHHYELLFSYPQVFHGGCFGVSGTPPLRLFIYIFI